MLRIVVTRAVLPGAQLAGKVIGVLSGNSREVRAHTLVVRPVAALARHDVAIPVAYGREFFAVGQLAGAGLFSALGGASGQLTEIHRASAHLLLAEHVRERRHGRTGALAALHIRQLLEQTIGIQPGQTRPGFPAWDVHAVAVNLVAGGTDGSRLLAGLGVAVHGMGAGNP